MTEEIPYEERQRRASKLTAARKAAGLTQRQAAEAAGFVSHRALQDWETGRHVPQTDQLRRIEEALGITYDTRLVPDLNAVDADVYVLLVALAVALESLEVDERAMVIARLIQAVRG